MHSLLQRRKDQMQATALNEDSIVRFIFLLPEPMAQRFNYVASLATPHGGGARYGANTPEMEWGCQGITHLAEDTFDASAEDGQIDAEMDTVEPSGESRPEKIQPPQEALDASVEDDHLDIEMATVELPGENQQEDAGPETEA
ncbi:hypothetical protein AnigIFM63309_011525 [Aspergillus niger]|nr:hypothetical protein AnigIFM63309_011525 [Aspergillus niger]